MSGDRVDPLNRPVRLRVEYEDGYTTASVIPHEFLARLDDEQRAQMAEPIAVAIHEGRDDMYDWEEIPEYQRERCRAEARAVVAALCEGARDE